MLALNQTRQTCATLSRSARSISPSFTVVAVFALAAILLQGCGQMQPRSRTRSGLQGSGGDGFAMVSKAYAVVSTGEVVVYRNLCLVKDRSSRLTFFDPGEMVQVVI